EECRLDIVESPRFFESMLRERTYLQASHIASRICGICAVAHALASLKATEEAMGIEISEQTLLLRKTILYGEVIQSHVLHIYLLAAPDFFGLGSVFPLLETNPEIVRRALRMKQLANDLCGAIGGRHVHPITLTPGGFSKVPDIEALREIKDRIEQSYEDLDATIETLKTVAIPKFQRPTEYVALTSEEEFALYDGDIGSSERTEPVAPRLYRRVVHESVVPHSSAKHVSGVDGPILVGALARVNNNYDRLGERAKKTAAALGLSSPCHNPFMNTIAQVVEVAECYDRAVEILDILISEGVMDEHPRVTPQAGRGVGVVEAPRGTLYHEYTYDRDGRIIGANCIIPTNQNLANIEADMYKLVPTILDKEEDQIRQTLEVLVRAYDPCISCSTHLLNVRLKRE
ncbi:MAG: Ni/Fe hydrogenase subunit alpha, partial [bacterium]